MKNSTNKVYTALARALKESKPQETYNIGYIHRIGQWAHDCRLVAAILHKDNPGFDTHRFLTAVGHDNPTVYRDTHE